MLELAGDHFGIGQVAAATEHAAGVRRDPINYQDGGALACVVHIDNASMSVDRTRDTNRREAMPRRPKSLELHAIDGTRSEAGRKRVPGTRQRAKPPAGQPLAPTARVLVGGRGELRMPRGLDKECRAAWRELHSQCAAVLDQADAAMLEVAAVALGRTRQARASITAHGMTVQVERVGRGRVAYTDTVPNPAIRLERDYTAMLHRAMLELGIGPTARARFSGAGVQGLPAVAALDGLGELVAFTRPSA